MNTLYTPAREGFLAGEIVWKEGGSVIKAALVRGYTFSIGHKFVSDVTGNGGTIVATETLNSLANADGVADAADAVWESVSEGAAIPHCIIYQASAVTGGADVAASSQRLIVFVDRGPGITTNTLIPNGQNVTSQWSPGADRIFRI
jgi:hypothetical protein